MASSRKRQLRLTYVLQHPDAATRHVGGANALQLAPGGKRLWSGGRDATVRRWNLDAAQPRCEAVLQGHADWVTDVALLGGGLAVSASADGTVCAWRQDSGQRVARVCQHKDYITSIAAPPQGNTFASGGLGGEVYVWDAGQSLRPVTSRSSGDDDASTPGVRAVQGAKESVYALAMNATGTVLAGGSTERAVRVWDPRTGAKACSKLKGHGDTVRALVLDESGRLLLSAGSDRTVRLWDLGQQRCVQAFAAHADSVWALAVNPSFSTFYSGGRDHRVYATDLASRQAALLFSEEHPVQALELDTSGEGSLWVATSGSSIRKWFIGGAVPVPPNPSSDPRSPSPAGWFGGTTPPVARPRPSIDITGSGDGVPVARMQAAAVTIPGAPALTRHAVLSDRRRVLTRDADGDCQLWDVMQGTMTREFKGADFADTQIEVDESVIVPSWFTADTRLGTLAVHLEPPSCFAAEAYALELGVEGATDELRLNIGGQVVRSLLERWKTQHLARSPGAAGPYSGGASAAGDDAAAAAASAAPSVDPLPLPVPAPALLSGAGPGLTHAARFAADTMEGSADEEAALPGWAADLVLGRVPPPAELPKLSFYLLPSPGSRLETLSQSKLSAPRILPLRKILHYVTQKFAGDGGAPPPRLEIVCHDKVLAPHMSLATASSTVWKRSDELVLHFRRTADDAP